MAIDQMRLTLRLSVEVSNWRMSQTRAIKWMKAWTPSFDII